MNAINFAAILSVALLGSFGHCVGMCGGFIAALSGSKIGEDASPFKKFFFYLAYHLGRVSFYALLGAICGALGQVLSFSSKAQGFLFFAIGCLMMLMGVSLIGKMRFLSLIEGQFILKPFTKKAYSFLIASKSFLSFYVLGTLNGFMPCGFVYFFAASAAASGSAIWGAVVMAIFGVATIPALIGFGFIVEFGRNVMARLAGFMVILYGIYVSYRGYVMSLG
jgi:sulfite exporter TauE/SafE